MVGHISDSLEDYATRLTTPLPPLLDELKVLSWEQYGGRTIVSGEIAGMLLKFLVASLRARRVLEIGMFTGFSALIMASALPEDGELITCDMNPTMEEVAKSYFARSPHGKKIQVRMGPALETLKTLDGPFDLIFIDADKDNYIAYYERSLELLAPGGLIAVDNTLWYGHVLDPQSDSDRYVVAFNEHVQNDPRVENVVLTVRDGITLIRKVA
jgi:caffeoyl-CoA O-methyltransferase